MTTFVQGMLKAFIDQLTKLLGGLLGQLFGLPTA